MNIEKLIQQCMAALAAGVQVEVSFDGMEVQTLGIVIKSVKLVVRTGEKGEQ